MYTRARALLGRWAATAIVVVVVLGMAAPAAAALATGPVRGREPAVEFARGRVHIPAGRLTAAR